LALGSALNIEEGGFGGRIRIGSESAADQPGSSSGIGSHQQTGKNVAPKQTDWSDE
jgi:hypothetical protein